MSGCWRLCRLSFRSMSHDSVASAHIPHPHIGDSDFSHPSGEYGLPLHPMVTGVGAPESARLLDKGPVPGSGLCPVHNPLTLRASYNGMCASVIVYGILQNVHVIHLNFYFFFMKY